MLLLLLLEFLTCSLAVYTLFRICCFQIKVSVVLSYIPTGLPPSNFAVLLIRIYQISLNICIDLVLSDASAGKMWKTSSETKSKVLFCE